MFEYPQFTQAIDKTTSPDPLGTASVNMALYGSIFPGINNRVQHLRIYSAICWMVLRVKETADEMRCTDTEFEEMSEVGLAKIQLLFAWCNLLEKIPGLPGGERNWPTNNDLTTLRYDTLFGREAAKRIAEDADAEAGIGATFLTAPEYKPSIINGLRFIRPSPTTNTYCLTDAGLAMAKAYGAHVAKVGHKKTAWFCNPTALRIRRAEVISMYDLLRLDKTTAAERTAFLSAYFPSESQGLNSDVPNCGARHLGLTLALRALAAEEEKGGNEAGFVHVNTIRHAMARGTARDGTSIDLDGLEQTASWWANLQLRQYLRLVLDSLLRMTETRVHDATVKHRSRDIRAISLEIGAIAASHLSEDTSQSVGQLSQRLRTWQGKYSTLYSAGARKKQVDLPLLVESLRSHRYFRQNDANEFAAAEEAYFALVYCAQEAKNLSAVYDFDLQLPSDRLSFNRLIELVDHFESHSPAEFVAFIVQHYVVNLHFTVVRERNQDDFNARRKPKNRFRILLGDQGLERNLQEERRLVQVTFLQDRLYHALLLLAQSGLLTHQEYYQDDGGFKLTAAGRSRLPELLAESIKDAA